MRKIRIYENGQQVTFFYCTISEFDRVKCVLAYIMQFANRLTRRNYQFDYTDKVYSPVVEDNDNLEEITGSVNK